ncbi:MAG: LysR family transcriptional regulator [Pseudomonadota bacterium]
MNLTQITAFEAVMTSASLSEAAKKLGRTQPAVSAAIRSLEDQLGLKLFHREGRKLVPVPEAQYLLIEAQAILDQLSQVRSTMRSLVDGSAGNIALAAMPGPVSMLFPRFIARQISGNKNINVSIMARSSVQIAELVRAQNIDFGFADALDDMDDIDGTHLFSADVIEGRCFVAVPLGHPLAGRHSLALEDLSGENLGTLQSNHAHRRDLEDRFARAQLAFQSTVESQTFLPILQFVAAGQCCAILDPLTVAHVDRTGDLSKELAILPLQEAVWYRYAIFSPNHRPISLLAQRLHQAWLREVCELLDERDAQPRVQSADIRSLSTSS